MPERDEHTLHSLHIELVIPAAAGAFDHRGIADPAAASDDHAPRKERQDRVSLRCGLVPLNISIPRRQRLNAFFRAVAVQLAAAHDAVEDHDVRLAGTSAEVFGQTGVAVQTRAGVVEQRHRNTSVLQPVENFQRQ